MPPGVLPGAAPQAGAHGGPRATLTQGGQAPVVLQHDLSVQCPLIGVQMLPLSPGELYNHVLECHWVLRHYKRQR